MNIIYKPSPNYSTGRENKDIDRIVIHWVGQGTAESAAAYFANPASEVSAHYILGNNTSYQCVAEKDTAWHSGNWTMNLRSIGIEHEARPDLPLSDKVYKMSGELVRQLSTKYDIPIDRDHIIGHREVKATQCPGNIDIDRIIREAKGEEECQEALQDMRASRNFWKKGYEELETQLATERKDSAKEKARRDEIIDIQKNKILELENKVEELEKEVEEMAKAKPVDYAKWKLVLWRFVRVFLVSFLTAFGAGMAGVADYDQAKALLLSAVTAGVVALFKALREYVAKGEYDSLLHRLPL